MASKRKSNAATPDATSMEPSDSSSLTKKRCDSIDASAAPNALSGCTVAPGSRHDWSEWFAKVAMPGVRRFAPAAVSSRFVQPETVERSAIVPAVTPESVKARRTTRRWLEQVGPNDKRLHSIAAIAAKLPPAHGELAKRLVALVARLTAQRRRVDFDAASHKYKADGVELQQSVTGSLDEICGPFDADRAIRSMTANKSRWRANKIYKECSFDELGNELDYGSMSSRIKSKWQRQAALGTAMHDYIHRQYDGDRQASTTAVATIPSPDNLLAYQHWEDIRFRSGWLLLESEFPVVSLRHGLAGTIDAIYVPDISQPHQVVLVDWKRAMIKTTVGNMFYEHPLTARYAKSNYWKYALQLNLYRELLEDGKEYGLHVIDMYIVSFVEDQTKSEVFGVPRMLETKEFMRCLEEREASQASLRKQ